jgi:23S rRNA (uracil1939-C5)-methyltransferase
MPHLLIDKLAFGGAGFGRVDGKACFVPYTAPGDRVEISVVKSKSSYLEGTVQRVETPAPCRVTPLCPVFGICGGCDWQHVSAEMQCQQKELIFAETMWRMARIDRELIRPLLAAENPYGYRQRIQLKVHCSGDGLFLGFFQSGTHRVVDLPDGCAIARPELNRAMAEVRWIIASSPEPRRIPQVDLSVGEDGRVTALVHYIGTAGGEMRSYLAGLEVKLEQIAAICLQVGRKESINSVFGPELLGYTLTDGAGRELSLSYSADSFSQINFRQNRRIVDAVLAWTAERSVGTLLDLFCGNGNFSLPLASLVRSVVGMEAYPRSIELARHNARENGIDHATFFCEDAAAGVSRLATEGAAFDMILLDPPRSGADAVVRNLHRLQPEYLVYVSCDPPTLGRDLALLQKSGFQVESIQPVDMFPQTYHLESVTFLQAV